MSLHAGSLDNSRSSVHGAANYSSTIQLKRSTAVQYPRTAVVAKNSAVQLYRDTGSSATSTQM
eukprot:SAG11_NODE_16851_length_535_cov_1.133028_1_plen_62_part_10